MWQGRFFFSSRYANIGFNPPNISQGTLPTPAPTLVLTLVFYHRGLFKTVRHLIFKEWKSATKFHQLFHQLAFLIHQLAVLFHQLATGHWQLATGIFISSTGNWQLATRNSQLAFLFHQLAFLFHQLATGN